MFNKILEWVTLIAGFVSIAASMATLIAAYIAYKAWKNWKVQQNYSFERDKIFECELVYSQLLTCLENYFEIFKREVPFHPNRINTINLELTNVPLREVRDKLEPLWFKYELALYSLEVLEVEYIHKLLSNRSIYESRFKEYINLLSQCKTDEEVGKVGSKILKSLHDDKISGLNELKRLRANL